MGLQTTVWNILIQVLRCGRVPRHVAVIMDGNRRYADKSGIDRKSGHAFGFESLMKNLDFCMQLGVSCVTLYAFSIDNFERSADEVSCLMDLMEEKLNLLASSKGMAQEYGIRIQVAGKLSLLPPRVCAAAKRAMNATKDNSKHILNICMAYSSTGEIVNAMQEAVREKCKQQHITEGDEDDDIAIREDDIERHLYTAGCPSPELLIRTSGETRLSNFLLWQCSDSYLAFSRTLWPEFSVWHLFCIIVQYQRSVRL